MTPAKPGNLSLGALYTVLAMLGFAGMDAMSKWLVADYAISQMMWIRYGVFSLFAWFVVRRTGLRASFRTRRPWLQAARSVLAVIESAIFVLAFNYLPLADAHAIAATAPLIVIALGVLFLGERAGAARWLAVLTGFVGVLLIVRPGFRVLDWPLMLPLLGAMMWGGYQIL
ncbi:MAG TPA: DMT family transporter, partial [Reyranella sp.]|nr:DMT family transporter [Reyranella sp.]